MYTIATCKCNKINLTFDLTQCVGGAREGNKINLTFDLTQCVGGAREGT